MKLFKQELGQEEKAVKLIVVQASDETQQEAKEQLKKNVEKFTGSLQGSSHDVYYHENGYSGKKYERMLTLGVI